MEMCDRVFMYWFFFLLSPFFFYKDWDCLYILWAPFSSFVFFFSFQAYGFLGFGGFLSTVFYQRERGLFGFLFPSRAEEEHVILFLLIFHEN